MMQPMGQCPMRLFCTLALALLVLNFSITSNLDGAELPTEHSPSQQRLELADVHRPSDRLVTALYRCHPFSSPAKDLSLGLRPGPRSQPAHLEANSARTSGKGTSGCSRCMTSKGGSFCWASFHIWPTKLCPNLSCSKECKSSSALKHLLIPAQQQPVLFMWSSDVDPEP